MVVAILHRVRSLDYQTLTYPDVRTRDPRGYILTCRCGWRSLLAKDPIAAYRLYEQHLIGEQNLADGTSVAFDSP